MAGTGKRREALNETCQKNIFFEKHEFYFYRSVIAVLPYTLSRVFLYKYFYTRVYVSS